MVKEFLLLMINMAAFCSGSGTNETEMPTMAGKHLQTNETKTLSGMYQCQFHILK